MTGGRSGVFALPASTSFRFPLLAVAVTVSSAFVYQGIFFAFRGAAWHARAVGCLTQALNHSSGLTSTLALPGPFGAAIVQANACTNAAFGLTEALWALLGIAVLLAVAVAGYLVQPQWLRRRKRLQPLSPVEFPALVTLLETLRVQAGVGPVEWLLQPLNLQVSAFTFGRAGRRCVAISGGAAVAATRQPRAFSAVVLHELGHVRNRDIDQAYLAVWVWRAFVVTALVPLAVLLAAGLLNSPLRLAWRVTLLALLVYLLRNWVLRSREFDADARVPLADPDTALAGILFAAPPRPGGRLRVLQRLTAVHPPSQERATALRSPERLSRCGLWDGIALGVVTGLAADAIATWLALLRSDSLVNLIGAAAIAPLTAVALVAIMWRARYFGPPTPAPGGWKVGLGLGVGLAIGPLIALPTALLPGIVPDNLAWPAFAVLGAWVVVCVVLTASLPVWIGHWADSWQTRPDAPRVPARGGMFLAIVAVFVAVAVTVGLLLSAFVFTGPLATDPTVRHDVGSIWTDIWLAIVQQAGAWAFCLALLPVSVAAFWRRPVREGQVRRRVRAWWLASGLVTVVALVLAISATAHFGIAEPVRWHARFIIQLISFDQQAVPIAAVAVVAATAALWSSRQVPVLLVAAAGIAAVAIVVVAYTGTIGSCASPFSIWYAKPIAGHCPAAGPSVAFLFTQIREAAVGAALLGFIVLPAAYRGGRTLASSLQAAGPVLRRTSAATVAAGAGAALCWWAVTGSAHGIVPAGSIGQDGFLREAGYTIRLMPYWYDQTAAGPAAPVTLTDSLGSVPGFGSARFSVLSAPASASADQADEAKLLSLGARWTSIGGAPALRLRTTNLLGDSEDVWFVSHDGTERLATLVASSDVATLAESDTAAMMATWTWTSQTRFAGGGP